MDSLHTAPKLSNKLHYIRSSRKRQINRKMQYCLLEWHDKPRYKGQAVTQSLNLNQYFLHSTITKTQVSGYSTTGINQYSYMFK